MLKSVDILIGFSVIMLVVSISVTLVNQMITGMLNLKGSQLRDGVCRLLRYIDHGINDDNARVLANLVLKDPIVATPRLIGGHRFASIIQREELTVLLMRIAADEATELNFSPLPETDQTPAQTDPIRIAIEGLEAQVAAKRKAAPLKCWLQGLWNRMQGQATRDEKQIAALWLRKSIRDNGLSDLHGALKCIRDKIVELEIAHPSWSASTRANRAILACAQCDFVAKINSWFDQTIDRVEEAYTSGSLIWTMLAALVIACALQLDSLSILNRLGVDDKYRATLVMEAGQYPDLVKRITQAPGDASPVQDVQASAAAETNAQVADAQANATEAKAKAGDPTAKSELPMDQGVAQRARRVSNRLKEVENQEKSTQDAILDVISTSQIIRLPDYDHYWTQMKTAWPGVLLSAALLSLGGPFWYAVLANLLKLRSVLASKDDENRKERQSTQNDPRGKDQKDAQGQLITP
ncbi:MAG TPA: hypothetical protein VGM25_12325 [Caulobacteraceae bacterium]